MRLSCSLDLKTTAALTCPALLQPGKPSRGAGKRSGMGRPPVAVDLDEAALQKVLPLSTDASAEVPITVRIGEGRTDAAGSFHVLVKLEYLGEDEEPALAPKEEEEDKEQEGAQEAPAKGKEAPATRPGRVLELPVSLTVHKMLRIVGCTFFRGDVLLPQASLCGLFPRALLGFLH